MIWRIINLFFYCAWAFKWSRSLFWKIEKRGFVTLATPRKWIEPLIDYASREGDSYTKKMRQQRDNARRLLNLMREERDAWREVSNTDWKENRKLLAELAQAKRLISEMRYAEEVSDDEQRQLQRQLAAK